ncbi:GNAT family N-acetyltransferase [Vibrio sp. S4M6]|uniref:GNAT family N-acetyltransferase n=1 Tax=Vibrio sinus TaxID=2946865 RepID=UPI00202A6D06|nr:GNAT family N-acetyltransferase [Vibrio sinus]MCL9780922.1 GNAT family N-acetyltransferase [Vibrio sinus]
MKFITETPRLIIREFTMDDAEAVLHFNLPAEVTQYTDDAGLCQNIDDAKAIIEHVWLKQYADFGFARWAVVLKASETVIGFCGFKHEPRINGVDIGYRFHPDYWGMGIATEASQACVDYARKHLDINTIYGTSMPENFASSHVLKKLGMQFVGQHKQDDLLFDCYRMDLR